VPWRFTRRVAARQISASPIINMPEPLMGNPGRVLSRAFFSRSLAPFNN
jgi:hypothetical protein